MLTEASLKDPEADFSNAAVPAVPGTLPAALWVAMTSQAEFWNGAGGIAWVEGQEPLDAQLAPVGALALDAAAVRPGEMVLDVGCGCGATTAELAGLVAPTGRVVGLDVSAPMLARARERVTDPRVEFLLGDAAVVELPADRFDLLFSRLGVMFFEEPTPAFAHLRSALKRGGRMSFAALQSFEANAWISVPAAAVADLVALPSLGGPHDPGPFSFADPDRMRSILAAAGFADVTVTGHDMEFVIGGGLPLHEAVLFTIDHGPLRRVLATAGAALRAVATDRIGAALARHDSPAGVRLPAAIWVVTARVP